MFQDLGERFDDWLHTQHIRLIRVRRRLGLYPKPTSEQIRAAEEWRRAMAMVQRVEPRFEFPPLGSNPGGDPLTGTKVSFRKWAPLSTVENETEITVTRHQYGRMLPDGTWEVQDFG